MHPILRIMAAGLLALGLACGGSSKGTPAPTPPSAPVQIMIGPGFDQELELSWNVAVQNQFDGFELQARINGGAFQPLFETLVPADIRGCRITFNQHVPELVVIDCQIRCVKGGLSSSWVGVSYTFPMLPPSFPSAFCVGEKDGHPARMQLSWSVESLIAETTTIFRRVVATPEKPWTQLTQVSWDVKRWDDLTPLEGVPCEYGFSHQAAGKPGSHLSISSRVVTPCSNPQNVRGTWNAGGIDLTWEVRSRTATQQSIYRFRTPNQSQKIADLDGTMSSFHDPDPPSGLTWYRIDTSNQDPDSLNQTNQILVAPPTMAGLRVSTLAQGTPDGLTRQSDGVWWLAQGPTESSAFGTLQSIGATPDVILPRPPIQVTQLLVGPNDSIQWMGGYNDLTHKTGHAWTSGGVLQSENLDALLPNGTYNRAVNFLLGPDAKLHAFVQEPHAYGTTAPLVHLQKNQDGWSRETLTSPWDQAYLPLSGIAADGTILISLRKDQDTNQYLGWWKPSGETGVDVLPGTSFVHQILPTPWGETYLLCQLLNPDGTHSLQVFHGQPGNWQGPVVMPSADVVLANYGAWVVDGIQQRILGLVDNSARTEKRLVTFQMGNWTNLSLGCQTRQCWAGTGPGGKFWLAFKIESSYEKSDPILILEDL